MMMMMMMMMMDFLWYKKARSKRFFGNLRWVAKTINKMSKASLLELAKKLNIPCRNEEAIKDTIEGYNKIILIQVLPLSVWQV